MVNFLNILFQIYSFISFFVKDISNSPKFRRNRSIDNSLNSSNYDNGSSSIFNDNDYEQDRLSLIETSSQRKGGIKQQKSPETIIHV
jgi:hypothetical protein